MIYQLFRYLRGFGWWVGLATFLGALTILSGIGLMGASAYLIVMAGFHPSIAILQVVIVGVRFFGISRSVSRYFERLVSHSVNLRILEKIRISIFEQLERHFPISLNDHPSSTILGLFIHDIEILENLFVRYLSPLLISIIVTFFVGIFVGFYAIELVIVITVGIFLVGFAIPFLSARISLKYGNEMAFRQTKYQQGLNDYFQHFQEVLLYQRNQTLLEKINSLEYQFAKIQLKQGLNQSIFSSISYLGTQATVLIAIFTSLYLIQNKQFASIMLAIFYTIFTSSFEAVSNFSVVANNYGNVKAAAIHISEIQNLPNNLQKKEVINLDAGFDIELSDVSFNYPATTNKVLKKINMSVQNGEKVAIVGKSGSGKTTLLQLLTGFYGNYSGSIKINGVELSHIDTKTYRNGFSYVDKDPYLFDTSIRQNLNLALDGVSDNTLEECIKNVSLDKRIINLDTMVGEHGRFLSGGEIQRLGIARALLQNNRCVFIDEPTANLDPVLAIDLINNMLNWFSAKTLVWVMHKYYSMSQFDSIYVISEGVIVEKGSHQELLIQKGLYHKLYFDQKKLY